MYSLPSWVKAIEVIALGIISIIVSGAVLCCCHRCCLVWFARRGSKDSEERGDPRGPGKGGNRRRSTVELKESLITVDRGNRVYKNSKLF